jgi:hypothetical protein
MDEAEAELLVTPLESALSRSAKSFSPDEQAALRAYEADQGPVEQRYGDVEHLPRS